MRSQHTAVQPALLECCSMLFLQLLMQELCLGILFHG